MFKMFESYIDNLYSQTKVNIMSEKKKTPEMSKISWLSDFTRKSIKTSADLSIKPKLTIELGIKKVKENIIILSEPYLIEIPKEKAIGSNELLAIDLEYQGISHQFLAQAGSFRFQLGVLMEKLSYSEPKELIGLAIKIWKTLEYINTPTFKGKAEMYHIELM